MNTSPSSASPHLKAGQIAAPVYVAGAIEDGSFTAEQAELLRHSLQQAGVTHTVEFYDAHHGFTVPDNATYDEQAATPPLRGARRPVRGQPLTAVRAGPRPRQARPQMATGCQK